jgi:hypothetical protein
VNTIFLLSHRPDDSPMRMALLHAPHQVEVFELRGSRPVCPITVPPQLVVVEAAPRTPVALLMSAIQRHASIGRVPALLVLDVEWLSMAPRLGCTDFISRGFSIAEALARVDRLLGSQASDRATRLRFGALAVDLDGHEARVDDEALALTPQEFALLRHLVLHAGRVQTRDELLRRVWGMSYDGGVRTVDIHVRRLRAKLGEPLAAHLQTIRQVGYKWVTAVL